MEYVIGFLLGYLVRALIGLYVFKNDVRDLFLKTPIIDKDEHEG
jgi:hypothetical protein